MTVTKKQIDETVDEPPAEHKFGCSYRKGGSCDCPVEVEQDGDEDGQSAEDETK